jgi:lipoprotein-anchoring transpeptidase ErfK/SrfK
MLHSDICMRWMVRFARTASNNNIGFHEIPRRNGVPLQTSDELGQALSGGCVRQATADAIAMWDWAQIGTVVVVVA